MLAKLSFRNAKRQAHDYIIYFVTLTAIFSLIHGLNSLRKMISFLLTIQPSFYP